MKTLKIYLFLLIAISFISSGLAQTGYNVIVNKSVEITSLSKSEISKIFLKKTVEWSDESKISPVDKIKESSVRAKFSEDIHNKSVDAINSYWQRQIFSGRGVPPTEKKSDKEVIAFVRNNPGGIGYISKSTKANDVNIIKVTE